MTIVTRKNGQITTYSNTGKPTEGVGDVVGRIYRLKNGELIYVPGAESEWSSREHSGTAQLGTK